MPAARPETLPGTSNDPPPVALLPGWIVAGPANTLEATAFRSGAALAHLHGVTLQAAVPLREQVKAGVFPVRLKPEDWNSGPVNWLLDVIAPDRKTTGRVLANFGRVVEGGELRLHPVVAGLVDEETLQRLGVARSLPDTSILGKEL